MTAQTHETLYNNVNLFTEVYTIVRFSAIFHYPCA